VARPGLLKWLCVPACEGWVACLGQRRVWAGGLICEVCGLIGTGSGQGRVRPGKSCDQPRDPPENGPQEGLVGAGRRQVKPDLGFQLDHPPGDLDQAKA
jgi:hypothetical protein